MTFHSTHPSIDLIYQLQSEQGRQQGGTTERLGKRNPAHPHLPKPPLVPAPRPVQLPANHVPASAHCPPLSRFSFHSCSDRDTLLSFLLSLTVSLRLSQSFSLSLLLSPFLSLSRTLSAFCSQSGSMTVKWRFAVCGVWQLGSELRWRKTGGLGGWDCSFLKSDHGQKGGRIPEPAYSPSAACRRES